MSSQGALDVAGLHLQLVQQKNSNSAADRSKSSPEAMGCAQETFEGILRCLHRDWIHPRGTYTEEFLIANPDDRFRIDNKLDSMGCSSRCAPHQTFGIELCDIVQCKMCNTADQVRKVQDPQFMHHLYAAKILELTRQNPKLNALPQVISEIIKGENEFHMNRLMAAGIDR